MPDDDLTFVKLCEHLGLSPKTARKVVKRAGIAGRKDGTSLKFTQQQVQMLAPYRRGGPDQDSAPSPR